MIDYRFQGRLTYIGGGLNVQMSAWPAAASANWWEPSGTFTCVAAYQAKGAADAAASYVNLANSGTYDLTVPSTGPTFNTSTGWTFNGISTRLETGITTTNSMSAIIRFSNCDLTNGVLFGATKPSQVQFNIYAGYTDGNSYFRAGGNYNTGTRYTSGVLAVTPAAAYANGSSLGSLTGALTGTTVLTIPIGCQNVDGTFTGGPVIIQAIAFYSTTLDATQVGEITTAMNAL